MPARSHWRVNATAVYWLPWSERNTTPRAFRLCCAIASAACTSPALCRAWSGSC